MPANIRLIAIDVDDTLITSKGTIPPRVVGAIKTAQQAGVVVTLATGRAFALAAPFARELELQAPLITNNGSLVCDLAGTQYCHWPLPHAPLAAAIRLTQQDTRLTPLLFVDDGLYAAHDTEPIHYYTSLGGLPATFVGDLHSFIETLPATRAVSNALLIGQDAAAVAVLLPQLQELFRDQLEVSKSKPRLIELTAAGVSKGRAVAELARHLGVEPRAVMAIGDSLNDVEMLRYAGISVAVSNARDEVLQLADIVVGTNEAGGVAEAIDMVIASLQGQQLV